MKVYHFMPDATVHCIALLCLGYVSYAWSNMYTVIQFIHNKYIAYIYKQSVFELCLVARIVFAGRRDVSNGSNKAQKSHHKHTDTGILVTFYLLTRLCCQLSILINPIRYIACLG